MLAWNFVAVPLGYLFMILKFLRPENLNDAQNRGLPSSSSNGTHKGDGNDPGDEDKKGYEKKFRSATEQ